MKRTASYLISTLMLFFLISTISISQEQAKPEKKEEKKNSFKDRFVFGGNIGLMIGTYTSIDISPVVGFYVTPRYLTGIGLTYQYYSETAYKSVNTIRSHVFGGRFFHNYTFVENIGKNLPIKQNFALFGHIEYEALNLDRDFSDTKNIGRVNRFWLNGILIGGGIKQPIGKRSSFNIAILYNLLADARTPYTNPFIRIGFYL